MPLSVSRTSAVARALVAASFTLSATARAQAVSSSLNVGIASGTAVASPTPSAFLLQPELRWDRPNASVDAQASWLASPNAQFDGNASISGRYFSPAFGKLRLELGAAAQRTAGSDVSVSSNALQSDASLSMELGAGGVWLSAGQRMTASSALPGYVHMFGAGTWRRMGSAVFTTTITASGYGSSSPLYGSDPNRPGTGLGLGDSSTTPDTIGKSGGVTGRQYADLESSVYWSHGPLSLDGLLGTRVSTTYGQHATWGRAQASWALGEQLAVVAAAGTRPSEPAVGRLGGSFFSFGVRLASAPWLAHALHPGARTAASSFGVRADGATRIIYVRAPAARTMELMADFTDWQPVLMRHISTDEWELAMPIAPGAHRVNIRVDGGEWSAPPGAGTVQDEFNGVVGLVVVP